MSALVAPDPDQLGIRVTYYTSMAKIAAALRRLHPDATSSELKTLAQQMYNARMEKPESEVESEVESDPAPVAKPARRSRRRTEADASMVPVEGGEPIPAEPPTRW